MKFSKLNTLVQLKIAATLGGLVDFKEHAKVNGNLNHSDMSDEYRTVVDNGLGVGVIAYNENVPFDIILGEKSNGPSGYNVIGFSSGNGGLKMTLNLDLNHAPFEDATGLENYSLAFAFKITDNPFKQIPVMLNTLSEIIARTGNTKLIEDFITRLEEGYSKVARIPDSVFEAAYTIPTLHDKMDALVSVLVSSSIQPSNRYDEHCDDSVPDVMMLKHASPHGFYISNMSNNAPRYALQFGYNEVPGALTGKLNLSCTMNCGNAIRLGEVNIKTNASMETITLALLSLLEGAKTADKIGKELTKYIDAGIEAITLATPFVTSDLFKVIDSSKRHGSDIEFAPQLRHEVYGGSRALSSQRTRYNNHTH